MSKAFAYGRLLTSGAVPRTFWRKVGVSGKSGMGLGTWRLDLTRGLTSQTGEPGKKRNKKEEKLPVKMKPLPNLKEVGYSVSDSVLPRDREPTNAEMMREYRHIRRKKRRSPMFNELRDPERTFKAADKAKYIITKEEIPEVKEEVVLFKRPHSLWSRSISIATFSTTGMYALAGLYWHYVETVDFATAPQKFSITFCLIVVAILTARVTHRWTDHLVLELKLCPGGYLELKTPGYLPWMPFTAKKVKLKHVSLYSRQFRLAALNAGNHNVASTKQGILDLYLDQGRSGVKVFKLDMGRATFLDPQRVLEFIPKRKEVRRPGAKETDEDEYTAEAVKK
eukprot:CAMPEP_0113959228 /NCGR_PEP_ID=MMETSP0011_2-20120614/4021_1 /TAXON_ID=101924 /ORGANISM="Rhodosorus marinus" /LENGTH=337 /DNA_ID=CAMNT_0000970503 /DNA_START=428 /DNA_END=1441 /DNA_ORIENTATION=+ /assembly_acc=CAM_ASM_000156